MLFLNLIKKILKRIYYVCYFNPKKKFYRKISYRSKIIDPSFLRISSDPYVSGDTFRKFAQHIFDETGSIKPNKVKENDIIFLRTDLKDIYFSRFHKEIKSKYILITHNSDLAIQEADLRYLDQNITHWFAMKLNVVMNENISPLPAGLENGRYFANGIVKNFEKIEKKNTLNSNFKKINKILCSFNPNTNNLERRPLLGIAENRDDVFIKNFSNNLDYLSNLSRYRYNLCPEGNDFESHRIWETLFYGNIPIVVKNKVNTNFIKLGIPLVVLNDWNELLSIKLENIDEEFLHNKDANPKTFVGFKFWKDLINQKKI